VFHTNNAGHAGHEQTPQRDDRPAPRPTDQGRQNETRSHADVGYTGSRHAGLKLKAAADKTTFMFDRTGRYNPVPRMRPEILATAFC
jgi:hypothetical protein